jgi:transposase
MQGELSRLDGEIGAMDRRIEATVRETGTSLTDIPGVEPFVAAKILGEVGDPSRVRSKAGFAVMSRTAPCLHLLGKPTATGGTGEGTVS